MNLSRRYVESPAAYVPNGEPSLFLAGGITDCPDWQQEVRLRLAGQPIVLLNPRRINFPIHDPAAARAQIEWEHFQLRAANVILFWFPAEQVQPIVLYELGAWSMTDKPIVVGAHPDYPRRQDVLIQTELARPAVRVAETLEATVDAAVAAIEQFLVGQNARAAPKRQYVALDALVAALEEAYNPQGPAAAHPADFVRQTFATPHNAIGVLEMLQHHIRGCREELATEHGYRKCWKPAEYVLWGKLIPPEGLGPRCYHHAALHVGHDALAHRSNYALINLADLARDLEAVSPPQSSSVIEDLRWITDRMDQLAFTEPMGRTWQDLYRRLRHELGDRLGRRICYERSGR